MTIKEIEIKSGMTRANIRFYESEGLLSPKRAENGYRDYSEDDLDILMRIRLLRELGMSLEEIKQLHLGEKNLQSALKNHIKKLAVDKKYLEISQEVCKIMNEDGVSYQTLDAQRYLCKLNQISEQTVQELEKDVLPRVTAPWKRFFARFLDMSIYSLIITVIFSLGLNLNLSNSSGWNIVDVILTLIMMWIIEPILLCVFGTTLGKWVLGLYVIDDDGNKLSYRSATERTSAVCWHGIGFCIPIFQYWKLWKSYSACKDGHILMWEDESELVLRDTRGWRGILYAGVYALVIFAEVVILFSEQIPRHRGPISTEQFCENYNNLADYYEIDTGEILDATGKWIQRPEAQTTAYITLFFSSPEFNIIEKDGEVVEVSFTLEQTNNTEFISSYDNYMMLAALSYMGAQKEIPLFSNDRYDIINCIEGHSFENFEMTKAGIKMSYDITYIGYEDADIVLVPKDGEDNYYRMEFKLEKVK